MGEDIQEIKAKDVGTLELRPTKDEQDAAAKRLSALLTNPGALRTITPEHRCHGGEPWQPDDGAGKAFVPRTADELERCAAFEYNLKDPLHFVAHDVVDIKEMASASTPGKLVAYTAEGDRRIGYPVELLRSLTRYTAREAAEEARRQNPS